MRHRFFDLAFTPAVMAEQVRFGSRAAYAHAAGKPGGDDELTTREMDFITARDSFYLATVGETGWPYVQHRGGRPGFVRQVDAQTIGWAEFTGNRQYVSTGNVAGCDRVAIILLDYPHQRRLKLLGHMQVHDLAVRPDLFALLSDEAEGAAERLVTVVIEAFDWNCPQHITPRFTLAEIDRAVAPLHARIAELEQALLKKI